MCVCFEPANVLNVLCKSKGGLAEPKAVTTQFGSLCAIKKQVSPKTSRIFLVLGGLGGLKPVKRPVFHRQK